MSLEVNSVDMSQDLVRKTVIKTLRTKIEEINVKLVEARKMMMYYEKKYGMKTDRFYEKFTSGSL